MEPENRIETNKTGFCGKHFSMMYNTQTNRLGLGLILDTYMQEQIATLRKISGVQGESGEKEKKSLLKGLSGRGKDRAKAAEAICKYWKEQEKRCCICADLEKTMDRYLDVVVYLYFSQKDFKEKFDNGMGYCMRHYVDLCEFAEKHLSAGKSDEFLKILTEQQLNNLDRIRGEVNWFTKKFDYRYTQEPWGNSRDSLPRGMRKLTGDRKIGTDK